MNTKAIYSRRAGELRAEGLDSGEIVARVAEEAGVSAGLGEFIVGTETFFMSRGSLNSKREGIRN